MNKYLVLTIICYLLFINTFTLFLCVYDKIVSKKKGAFRVPEKTLFAFSLIGGSMAMLLGMRLVRHKTKHLKFTIGIPLILILQAAVVFLLHYKFFI